MLDKLFKTIGPKFKERPGGYTRIIRLGRRMNDGAEMAIVEFVENFIEAKEVPADSTTKPNEKPAPVVPSVKSTEKTPVKPGGKKSDVKTGKPVKKPAKKTGK